MKSFSRFFNRKTLTVLMILVALLSMAPVLYCGVFDYANGDDLIGAAPAHSVYVLGGSVFEYFRAVIEATVHNYLFWDGNFASTFVWFAFEPSIFNEYLYKVVPFLAFACVGVNMIYAAQYFGRKYLNLSFEPISIFSVSILTYIVQYTPNIKSLLFWWTGIVSYIFPIGLVWLSLVWIDKYLEFGKIRYIVYLSCAMIFIGGAGYFTAILTLEVLVLVFLWKIVVSRSELKKRLGLLAPFLIFLCCFIVSYVAPGNSARAVAEGVEITPSMSKILFTVLDCIVIGGKDMIGRFVEIRPLFLLAVIVVMISWYFLDVDECKLKFKYPLPVVILMYLIYCSIYAPKIFAGAEVSGGGPNDIYIVFLVTLCISLIYLTGYVKRRMIEKKNGSKFLDMNWVKKHLVMPVTVLGMIFVIVCGRYLIGNSSGYLCYNFIMSGQLKDFDNQMKERIGILQSEEKSVILPMMNDDQGPFMHMALVENPDAYTNYATRLFYLKDSVIAIPRDEWNEIYGGK